MLQVFRPGEPPPRNERLDNLVRAVAERSVEDVCRQLPADMSRMGVAELRGYVRARALRPVRHHARTAANQTGRAASVSDVLAGRALERTVQLVLRRLLAAPATQLRAAG